MVFDFGRKEGFPTQYASNQTPVTVDVLETGFIVAFCILAVSFFVSFLSTRISTNISLFIRVTVTLLTGLILILGNFGQEWEVGSIRSRTPYKAGVAEEINAAIAIKIGLRNVNVTLKTESPNPPNLRNEIINYNERFSWVWDQGRFGFGPYAGHLQQEFRAGQYRGLPIPIIWVVDYFVIDGEGFRHGRFYRTAGWYTHIVLWTAFSCWILSIILFRSVLLYGGYCLGLCGILQLVANFIWVIVRNPLPLVIPFEDAILKTKFGASFWLVFGNGMICLFLAVVIIVMDYKFDSYLYTFFGVDPLTSYDEIVYLTKEEQLQLRKKASKNEFPLQEMPESTNDDADEYIPIYVKRHTMINNPPRINRSNKPVYLLS